MRRGCASKGANLAPTDKTDGATPILSTAPPTPSPTISTTYATAAAQFKALGAIPPPKDV